MWEFLAGETGKWEGTLGVKGGSLWGLGQGPCRPQFPQLCCERLGPVYRSRASGKAEALLPPVVGTPLFPVPLPPGAPAQAGAQRRPATRG